MREWKVQKRPGGRQLRAGKSQDVPGLLDFDEKSILTVLMDCKAAVTSSDIRLDQQ